MQSKPQITLQCTEKVKADAELLHRPFDRGSNRGGRLGVEMQHAAFFLVGVTVAKVAEETVFYQFTVFADGYLKGNIALCVGTKTLGNGFYILLFHGAATFREELHNYIMRFCAE